LTKENKSALLTQISLIKIRNHRVNRDAILFIFRLNNFLKVVKPGSNMIHISLPKIPPRIPLRLVLIVPFILQLLISVSLVGGLSFYNSQATVHQLVARLLDEVGKNIQQHLDAYLTVPMLIAKLNAQAV